MTVSILGCGWFGSALAKSLIGKDIIVKGSTTSPAKLLALKAGGIDAYLVNITAAGENVVDPEFFRCDLLVISISTRGKDSMPYLDKIRLIASLAKQHKIKRVVFTSSIGVYGDHNGIVNEASIPLPGKQAGEILLSAEALLKSSASFSTVVIRFGGLVGPGRHPGNFLAGKTEIPNGAAPVNLIHLDDCIGISELIILNSPDNMTINAVAPDHPAKGEFYTAAAAAIGATVPQFNPDKAQWKIVESIYMDVLNYQFKVNDWMEWLNCK